MPNNSTYANSDRPNSCSHKCKFLCQYFFFQIEFGLTFSYWICGPSQLFRNCSTVHLAPVVNTIRYSSVLEVGNDGSFGMVPVLKKYHQHDPGYGLWSIWWILRIHRFPLQESKKIELTRIGRDGVTYQFDPLFAKPNSN